MPVEDPAFQELTNQVKKYEWGKPPEVHRMESQIAALEQRLQGYPPQVWERVRSIEWAQVRLNLGPGNENFVLADVCPQCWTFVLPGTITNVSGDTRTYKSCHVDWHEHIGW